MNETREFTIVDFLNEHQKITLNSCVAPETPADLSHLRKICAVLGQKYDYNFRLDSSDKILWQTCNNYIRDLFAETK